ncbi:hypothetical protein [Mesorhizobium sp. Z1-4]|uniref:hypothetical protein n=1 Tax=Mesorhizobium sp. Z1-4 TaxID=2448478 RepID=UPI000FDAB35F|nr:hypothetical protein [Mesorhizobium sp. Z1-4]
MPSSLETAKSLSSKLQNFYSDLNQAEQKALSDLLESVAAQTDIQAIASGPEAAGPSKSDLAELDILLAEAKNEVGGEIVIGPTITLTTTITITASHPIITCK